MSKTRFPFSGVLVGLCICLFAGSFSHAYAAPDNSITSTSTSTSTCTSTCTSNQTSNCSSACNSTSISTSTPAPALTSVQAPVPKLVPVSTSAPAPTLVPTQASAPAPTLVPTQASVPTPVQAPEQAPIPAPVPTLALVPGPTPTPDIVANSLAFESAPQSNVPIYSPDQSSYGAVRASSYYQSNIPGSAYDENYQQPIVSSYGRGYGATSPYQPSTQPNIFVSSQAPQSPLEKFSAPPVSSQSIVRPFIPSTPPTLKNVEQYQQPTLGSHLYRGSANHAFQPMPSIHGPTSPLPSQANSVAGHKMQNVTAPPQPQHYIMLTLHEESKSEEATGADEEKHLEGFLPRLSTFKKPLHHSHDFQTNNSTKINHFLTLQEVVPSHL